MTSWVTVKYCVVCGCAIAFSYKKLSYRRGTARRVTLVNSCCFASYGSYKGLKQQKWTSMSFKGTGSVPFDRPHTISYYIHLYSLEAGSNDRKAKKTNARKKIKHKNTGTWRRGYTKCYKLVFQLPLQLCLYLAPFPRYYHLFPKILIGHVTLNTSLLVVICHACIRTPLYQSDWISTRNLKCLASPITKIWLGQNLKKAI